MYFFKYKSIFFYSLYCIGGVIVMCILSLLDQAGLVPENVVDTACTVSAPFLLGCQATPAAEVCTVAGAACGIYGAGKWAWGKITALG